MKMQPGMTAVYNLQDLAVILKKHSGKEATLKADLRRSLFLCLICSLKDLFVGKAKSLAMLKRAEPAASYALVSEVDVHVYDKRDLIFSPLLAQSIGQSKKFQRL